VFAAIVNVKLPLVSVPVRGALGGMPPPESDTIPVGVVPPASELATVTVTLSATFELMLADDGVTVTIAVPVPTCETKEFTTFATFIDPRPVARSKPAVALYASVPPAVVSKPIVSPE
jgi:hypothetical protein